MTSILISRFLLNLQYASSRTVNLASFDIDTTLDITFSSPGEIVSSRLSFARFVGSLGSTLDYRQEELEMEKTWGGEQGGVASPRHETASVSDGREEVSKGVSGIPEPGSDIELQPVGIQEG